MHESGVHRVYLYKEANDEGLAREVLEILPGLSLAFEVEPLGMLFALAACALGVSTWGFAAFVRSYLIPQMIANLYLCAITFMQHTHEDVPHFDDAE